MDYLPVEAACKVMTPYCAVILALAFARTIATSSSQPRVINREKQTNGSYFQVVSSGGGERRGAVLDVDVGVKMIEGQTRAKPRPM